MGSMTYTNEPQPIENLDRRIVAEIPVLRAFLGKLAPADGEDLLQDALERALRYRGAFDAGGSLRGWLLKTAYRAFLNHHRKRARAPASLPDPEALVAVRPAESGEIREELDRLLTRLSPPEREVMVRFHGRGESLAEIGAALGMPINTVKSHLHRARKKFAGL
jgi:RNA polymerase sigma-70 factor (ECF subfamily)